MNWNPYASACPTRFVLDRIADKWTVLVLSILLDGPIRFNALARRIEGLSPKVASQLLKGLERDGLVTRAAFPTVPITVEYSITRFGETLAMVLRPLIQWAEDNIESVLRAQDTYATSKRGDVLPRASASANQPSKKRS